MVSLRNIGLLWGLFVSILGTIYALAPHTTPLSVDVLMPDQTCDRAACWSGIMPTYTDIRLAESQLNTLPFLRSTNTPRRWNYPVNGQTHQVQLITQESTINITPDQITLGDILIAMGTPDRENVLSLYDTQNFPTGATFNPSVSPPAQTLSIELFYEEYRLYIVAVIPPQTHLSPQTPIQRMIYYGEASMRARGAGDWQGLGRRG